MEHYYCYPEVLRNERAGWGRVSIFTITETIFPVTVIPHGFIIIMKECSSSPLIIVQISHSSPLYRKAPPPFLLLLLRGIPLFLLAAGAPSAYDDSTAHAV